MTARKARANSDSPGFQSFRCIDAAGLHTKVSAQSARARAEYPKRSAGVEEQAGTRLITDVSFRVTQRQIERASRHWVVITTPENYRICMAQGLWGVERQTKTIHEVKPGDVITFYIAGAHEFSGMYKASTECFYDPKPVWPDKVYPWRVRIEPMNQLGRIYAPDIKTELPLIRDPGHWGTFLQGEMKSATTKDFRVLLREMKTRAHVDL